MKLRSMRNGAFLLLLCLFSICNATTGQAGGCLEEGDEVWLISTRHLPSCGYYDGRSAPNYSVYRYEEGRWQSATLQEYFATQAADAITVAHIHGNRYDQCDAIERGWQTYQLVRACESPWSRIRMVIWSWPSDKLAGPIKDIRTKAARTSMESYYLGYFLAHHNSDSQISLIGHSFGARIVCGGLHIAAGGRLCSGYLQNPPPALPPMRATIMAAAMHNYWLAQGQRFGHALSAVQSMRIIYNPYDRFLIRYQLLVRWDKPRALGITGPTGNLGAGRNRIELYNASPYVGTAHFQRVYYNSAPMRKLIREHATWQEANVPPVELDAT